MNRQISFPGSRLVVSFFVLGLGLSIPHADLAAEGKAPELAAVLAVASGDVSIRRGDETIEASYGAPLRPGDVVATGEDAEAAILFESGQIIELGPGSRITVSAIPSPDAGGAVMAQVADGLSGGLSGFARTDLGGDGLSVLPELRSGAEEAGPEPLYPRKTLVRPGPVTCSWMEVEDALEYTVTFSSESGRSEHRATGNSLDLPRDVALEPGRSWTWRVEAVTADGVPLSSRPVSFDVASQEVSQKLVDLEQYLGPLLADANATRSDAALYLLGSYCRNLGFYGDAIQHLETLAGKHPERRELHRDLGALYQAVGRDDLAAEAFKRALAD